MQTGTLQSLTSLSKRQGHPQNPEITAEMLAAHTSVWETSPCDVVPSVVHFLLSDKWPGAYLCRAAENGALNHHLRQGAGLSGG